MREPHGCALLSLSDTTGAASLARALLDGGAHLYATGGTRAFLERNGIPSTDVQELTGFPPLFGGRVKTLHPHLFGAILYDRASAADRDEAHRRSIPAIDTVVVTLYPPPEIDVGGVALLRAAAKNYASVSVLSDPEQYAAFVETMRSGAPPLEYRRRLAVAALERTAAYDASRAADLGGKRFALRYGENPQQIGAFYATAEHAMPEQLHGKALSYNNLLDLDAALRLLTRVEGTRRSGDAVVRAAVVKHTIPCGVAQHANVEDAVREALDADRISAYGGIVAIDATLTPVAADALATVFLEIVAATGFHEDGLARLRAKRNLRVMRFADDLPQRLVRARSMRSALGGLLVEAPDPNAEPERLRVASKRVPSDSEWRDLLFAWDVVRHVKSNGIVVAKGGVTRGICAGQTNRVSAVEIAVMRAGDTARGAACASDGFFPFTDGLEAAIAAGCSTVVAPGGSIRDEEIVAAADRGGIALVFSSHRHFLH
ncbi:MAG TPA: bifunctional phosphoribosylaminoimidazolecarboxamide formyltransferase/IMP cyclohydrolase [Candidatus Dormibacteraeota bacterium]|nr:bifunctional phosphoribosylaminoimidazolecarboxamide formyltransferase/IMP cyclohydrolase [Candidatus Dormibacteraeota bacterium]